MLTEPSPALLPYEMALSSRRAINPTQPRRRAGDGSARLPLTNPVAPPCQVLPFARRYSLVDARRAARRLLGHSPVAALSFHFNAGRQNDD
jgi:hypothetical protein